MRLLLLDRPVDRSVIRTSETEFFGPWAQPIDSPQDIAVSSFQSYLSPGSIYEASIKVMSETDSILNALTDTLNDLTGFKRTGRFWKFYLGHCIVLMASIVVDIRMRQRSLPEKDYILGAPSNFKLAIPDSWEESCKFMFFQDSFNRYAMFILLREFYRKQKPIEYEDYAGKRITGKCAQLRWRLSRINAKKVFNRVVAFYPQYREDNRSMVWDDYNFDGFDFGIFKNTVLFNRHLISGINNPSFQLEKDKRKAIRSRLPHPYGKLLSLILPLEALEGLPYLVGRIKEKKYLGLFDGIKKIYTHGQAFSNNGLNRLMLALLAEKGKKVISVQHGGGGIYYANSCMYLERAIADEYISWGPGYSQYNGVPGLNAVRPMPSIYLTLIKNNSAIRIKQGRIDWDILFLVFEEFRCVRWLYSPLFCELAGDYFRRQNDLFDYFKEKNRVAVKAFEYTFGWRHVEWIKAKYPKFRLLISGQFVQYAQRAELVIIDYASTGFLEMLAINRPFLITWNRRWFRGGGLFERFIDRLTQVGIFYSDPWSLAESYHNKILPDLQKWWNDKDRQDALKEMAGQFAMTSGRFCEEWQREFALQDVG